MTINSKKSSYIRVGPRHDKTCANIVTCDGSNLAWVDELRYLGIFIVRAPVFRCSLEHAKRSFYRAANGIFGKIGRIASEEVTIQLLKSQCLPLLLHALEVCNLTKRDLQSSDFTINRFFMKLFRTGDINVVTECQLNFHFQLPSVLLEKRREKFVNVYGAM